MCDVAGKRILVVEDEFFIADELAQCLVDLGAEVAGPYASRAEALLAADEARLDSAVLDIGLRGETVYPVARRLRRRGVPFVFYTGYPKEMLPEEFVHIDVIEKPGPMDDVLASLERLLQ